ncbi:MAG: TVP38/TMEM64 family protein [Firmicutes bacterium]|nr:TVP38/TMEM64 family protein [Bacillota bacterium]
MEKRTKERLKKLIIWLKFGLLIVIVVVVPLVVYFNYRELIDDFGSLEKINMFLSRHKVESIFVYLGLQVAQIVICILPGQVLQVAGGYVFHFGLGFLLTMIGAAIGTVLTFYIARVLGKDAMYLIFGEEKLNKYIDKLNSKRALLFILVMYLIPGIPKDLFAYAIGVSNMRFMPFLIVSLIGRAPAMMGSVIMGAMLETGSYTGVIILFAIAVILCILGAWKHKQLHEWIDKKYVKMMKL